MEARQSDEAGTLGQEAARTMRICLLAFSAAALMLAGCSHITSPSTSTSSSQSKAVPISSWRRFTASQGDYSVEFPGTPSEENLSIANANAFSASLAVKVPEGVCYYSTLSSTFLKNGVATIGPRAFLERLYQQVWVPKIKNRLIYKRSFEWNGMPAIEFQYGAQPTTNRPQPARVTSRQFVSGDTVYELTAILPPQRLAAGDFTHFYNSFRKEKEPNFPKQTP